MAHKRFFYVLLVTVLALLLLATVVAAQGRGGQLSTMVRVRGQAYVAPAGVKDAGAAHAPKQAMPLNNAAKMAITPQAAGPFVYRAHETFEGDWPTGDWVTFDGNGGDDICWDDTDYMSFQGGWSAWAADGCGDQLDPYVDYYASDMESWMVLGPFSTKQAKSGWLQFKYWNDSEEGFDYFAWCASTDDSIYYCKAHSGYTDDWKTGRLNLRGVPGYGNMLGEEQVWVAFIFISDGSVEYQGPFVDQVSLVVRK